MEYFSLRKHWFKLAVNLRGSVIPAIWERVLACMFFSILVTLVYFRGLPVNQPILSGLIPSIVIGLLLVFRTNTAYERFWEGRRLWDILVYTSRNLARNIWVMMPENTPEDTAKKIDNIRLIGVTIIAIKLNLRREKVIDKLKPMLSGEQYLELKKVNNIPQQLLIWLADYCHGYYRDDNLNNRLFIELNNGITQILNTLGGCERILTTPVPVAYSIHLRHLLILYCFALPFQMVSALGWCTIPVVGVISFSLLGIEEIGLEIENPFGYDANDLPLDDLCKELQQDIEELISSRERNKHIDNIITIKPGWLTDSLDQAL